MNRNKHPITDAVINEYIGTHAKNATLRHTTVDILDREILRDLLEYKNGRPKCTRNMRFISTQRLDEINKFIESKQL